MFSFHQVINTKKLLQQLTFTFANSVFEIQCVFYTQNVQTRLAIFWVLSSHRRLMATVLNWTGLAYVQYDGVFPSLFVLFQPPGSEEVTSTGQLKQCMYQIMV